LQSWGLPLFIRRLRQLFGGEDFGGDDLFEQGREFRFFVYGSFEYPEELK
jgi:hypothetical protein